jgi:ribokinase
MPARVAVLGSITADAIMRVPRFPAPGETLFADEAAILPGGKGLNQAIAAARLGAQATLLGRTGGDAFSAMLLDAAHADGVDTRFVVRDGGMPGLAVPVVAAGGENFILASRGANFRLTIEDIESSAEAIRIAGALLVQFETPMETVERAIAIADAADVPVILNPAPVRPFDQALLAMVDTLVLNEIEAAMLLPGAPIERAAEALLDLGPRRVVVTLGREGCRWATKDGLGALAAFTVEAIDTVGAGDGFCGALAVALCEGQPFSAAVRFASAAAAISVTRVGAAPSLARRDEVEALLAR